MPASPAKPVYLRGLPSEIVREAKAAAARRGVTLAGYVADALARAVQQRDTDVEGSADLSRERRWFERQRERLCREYGGEYVAILDRAVVDHDADFEALAERVFAKHGARSIFMPLVAKANRPARIRSPRTRRS